MTEFWVGIVAVALGALFCFWGATALRGLIALWGAVVGFVAGGLLASSLGVSGAWGAAAGWLFALVGAVLLGVLAYVFYAVSVVIAVATMGFALGVGLGRLIGVRDETALLIIGVVAALALGGLGLALNLPRLLLVILSASAGASLAITGLLLLTGARQLSEVPGQPEAPLAPVWYVAYVGFAVAGVVVQARSRRAVGSGPGPDATATRS